MVLAPQGGSITQEQCDQLVAVMGSADTERVRYGLSRMEPEASKFLVEQLAICGPEIRKSLISRIPKDCSNDILKKANGIQRHAQDLDMKEKGNALHLKRKQEAEGAEDEERELIELRRLALDWIAPIKKATTAGHWSAALLDACVVHKEGLRALLGVAQMNKLATCVVPRLIQITAVYKSIYTHEYDAFGKIRGCLGKFSHPSGETLELWFRPLLLNAVESWKQVFKDTDLDSLDAYPVPTPKPWEQDPSPMLPTLGLSGSFDDFLQACKETAQQRGSMTDPHQYNALLDKSACLELSADSIIQWSVLRSRFLRYCKDNGVDLDTGSDEELLTHAFLRQFDIKRYFSAIGPTKGFECVTGFAELKKEHLPLTGPEMMNHVRDPNFGDHPANLGRKTIMADQAPELANGEAMTDEQREQVIAQTRAADAQPTSTSAASASSSGANSSFVSPYARMLQNKPGRGRGGKRPMPSGLPPRRPPPP